MTKRELIIERIRIAGYEDDHKTAIRLYVENRISRAVFQTAFSAGQNLKKQEVAS